MEFLCASCAISGTETSDANRDAGLAGAVTKLPTSSDGVRPFFPPDCCDKLAESDDVSTWLRSSVEDVVSSASLPSPNEFTVVVRRTEQNRKLGVNIRQTAKRLTVLSVGHGLIYQWNQGNPDNRVEPGDVLVEVNGLRGVPGDVLMVRVGISDTVELVFDKSLRFESGCVHLIVLPTIAEE